MHWSTSASVHQLNTSHTWTIHRCNLEQLLLLRLYKVVGECTSPPVENLPRLDDSCMKSGLYKLVDKGNSPPVKYLPCIEGGLTNERPQTDHVIWGPLRGLEKKLHEKGQDTPDGHCDFMIESVGPFSENIRIYWYLCPCTVENSVKEKMHFFPTF